MKRAMPFVVVLCLLVIVGVAGAQVITGNLIGIVRDDSGGALPGVTLTLTSPVLPAAGLTVVSSQTGEYRFTELPPGTYSLNASLPGFAAYREEGLRVLAGGTIERIVVLKVGTVEETITVSGESPMVDPRRVGLAPTLVRELLENLPINRFSIVEFAKWTPGVTPTSPGGGGSITVMGSQQAENLFLYDGVTNATPQGSSGWQSGQADSVEEVQVTTLGASAEYQMAQGGVISYILKSGTNDYQWNASGYWYPDRLISKPITRPCNCPLGETGFVQNLLQDYSAHASGPFVRDHLWFFGGFKYSKRRSSNPGVNPENPRLWMGHGTNSKVTWQANSRLRFQQLLQTTFWDTPQTLTIARPFSTINHATGWTPLYASEMTATLSDATLLTARATGLTHPDHINGPFSGDVTTPYRIDQRTGIASGGVPDFGGDKWGRHGLVAKVNRYVQGARVAHDLRGGVQHDRGNRHTYNTLPSGVNYSDLGGMPDQATFRDPFVNGGTFKALGVWAEDQMTFSGRLTVSLGVRYDWMHAFSPDEPARNTLLEKTGATIKGLGEMFTWKTLAPRTGFNLKLTEDGKTILRGHYGRAFRIIFLNDFLNTHPGLSPITLARWNPATNSYSTMVSVTHPTANIAVDPNMDAPFADSYSAGLDRELMANVGVGATYVYKYGRRNIGWVDIGSAYGTRTEALPDGRAITVLPRLSPASQAKYLRTNGPGSFTRYNGVVLTLNRRYSRGWQANFSYTYQKADGLVTTEQDPNRNLNAAGLQNNDRTHVFMATGSYDIPRIEVMASATFISASGQSFAPEALVQLPQGRLSVKIAEADGTYRLPRQDILSLRFAKLFFRQSSRRVELATEVRNLLQNVAYENIITANFFSANFGQGSSWVEPRRMIFYARVFY